MFFLTAQQDGAARLADDLLLQRATDLDRVLVSQDKDLLREGTRRLREGGDFCGIVYAHQRRVTVGQMVEDLVLLRTATSIEEWHGRIEYLPIGRYFIESAGRACNGRKYWGQLTRLDLPSPRPRARAILVAFSSVNYKCLPAKARFTPSGS